MLHDGGGVKEEGGARLGADARGRAGNSHG